jgi:hypothetical protein
MQNIATLLLADVAMFQIAASLFSNSSKFANSVTYARCLHADDRSLGQIGTNTPWEAG